MQTYDVNTSDHTVDGTPPGETFSPLRYTTTVRDQIRVGLWLLLSTSLGTYRLDTGQGLDIEGLLDPTASDAERSAIVSEVVLGFTGVVAITTGPIVEIVDGTLVSISFTAETVDGPVEVAVTP